MGRGRNTKSNAYITTMGGKEDKEVKGSDCISGGERR